MTLVAGALLRHAERGRSAAPRRGHADKGGLDRARTRNSLQHRRGDDAERAFGADEQVLAGRSRYCPSSACCSLFQHAAVGQHHFEAEREVAGDCRRRGAAVPPALVERLPPIVQLPSAPSEQRKKPARRSAAASRALQHDAGFDGHRVRRRIDLADFCPCRFSDSTISPSMRHLAADQAGIAALRHDRGAGLVGQLEDLRNLLDRFRAQHQLRMADQRSRISCR